MGTRNFPKSLIFIFYLVYVYTYIHNPFANLVDRRNKHGWVRNKQASQQMVSTESSSSLEKKKRASHVRKRSNNYVLPIHSFHGFSPFEAVPAHGRIFV